ncbi:MAG TPA: DEAD/DEAH box helicase [Nitrosopumilaceae archaeon]|nr:DEAD/DEAH box helicase [Nitrosopumilaceae archaeon]
MKISDLNLPKPAIEFLHKIGYQELYPIQVDSVNAGILDGKSVLVSAPTAGGKTLIAMLVMIDHLFKNKGKIVYLNPLRALSTEKFSEFQKLDSLDFGRKISAQISTGDFGDADKNLGKNDIIVLTNEKMDSLIRHGAEWINDISLVIVDEVHLLGDQDRGPALEIILTKLKLLQQKPQILALSATVTNAKEIASWIGCDLIENNWRPVPLWEGVYYGGTVRMQNGKNFEVETSVRGPSVDLGIDSIKNGGQTILFAETRARSAILAAKAADVVGKNLDEDEKIELNKISGQILEANEHTDLVKNLATLVKKGVAFHHAGLNQKCRETIESEFRNGKIKLLASTPTLAAGVNLPARRVIISNINRYDAKFGTNKPISILEYKQLCGRAGRPQYDKFGEAIIIGNSNSDELIDYYVNGTPEPIISKLTDDRALRSHVLSLVATSPGIKKDEILDFFSETLAGSQIRKPTIKFKIQITLDYLGLEELIKEKGGRFVATEFGKKTSMLYIDPLTAVSFRKGLRKTSKRKNHTLGFLHLITNCEDFFPKFSLRNKDYETIGKMLENHMSELIEPVSEYECSRSLLALQAWINESSEIFLSDNLGIESGDMHRMAETSNWLVNSLYEIAKLESRDDILDELNILKHRIAYGIKEELTELVKIRGIGRIRSRILFKNGIKNRYDLSKIQIKDLAKIDKIGSSLAENIKAQLQSVS